MVAAAAAAAAAAPGPEIIEGQFSPVGRNTELTLKKLKSKVDAADEELKDLLNGTISPKETATLPKATLEAPEQEFNATLLLDSTLRSPKGQKISLRPSYPESSFSRTMKDKLFQSTASSFGDHTQRMQQDGQQTMATSLGNSGGNAGLQSSMRSDATVRAAEEAGSEHSAAPTMLSPTHAFTSMGQDADNLCHTAISLHRRFMHPTNLDIRPHLGHYNITETSVKERQPEWYWGERPKHLPIRPIERSNGMEVGDVYSSFGDSWHRGSSLEQASVISARPQMKDIAHVNGGPVFAPAPVNMTFARPEYKEWHKRDEMASAIHRKPDWDLIKHSGEHTVEKLQGFQYFEPAKYGLVNMDTVLPTVKDGVRFKRALGRAHTVSYLAPKAVLVPPRKHLAPDRSCFRGSSQTVPRKVNIQKFEEDVDRPPLNSIKAVYYDENDPVANAKVWEQEMSFDASIADHFVIPRRDHSIHMNTCVTRQRASKGNRMFENDLGMMHSNGGLSQTSVDDKTVEESKEVPSRARPDVGVTFNQMKGRYGKPSPNASRPHGSLRKPKESATFDFSRTAPAGFASRRAVAGSPVRPSQSRKHQALPTWDIDGQDELEFEPPPTPPARVAAVF